jgi:hypothetical protein
MCLDNSVSRVTRCRSEPGNRGSIYDGAHIFLLTLLPHRHWWPSSIIFGRNGESFLGSKANKSWSWNPNAF